MFFFIFNLLWCYGFFLERPNPKCFACFASESERSSSYKRMLCDDDNFIQNYFSRKIIIRSHINNNTSVVCLLIGEQPRWHIYEAHPLKKITCPLCITLICLYFTSAVCSISTSMNVVNLKKTLFLAVHASDIIILVLLLTVGLC